MIMPVGPKDKGVGAFENQGNMCLKHQQHQTPDEMDSKFELKK